MRPQIKWTLISGAALTLGGPILGACGTALGMMRAFDVLGKEGVADMTGMSSAISNVLIFTVAGILVGAVGVIILMIGAFLWLNARSGAQVTPPPPPSS